MKKIVHIVIAAAGIALAVPSLATPAQTAQREKMKACNAEAKAGAKKGDERKVFMKSCLSSGASAKDSPAASGKGAAAPKAPRP